MRVSILLICFTILANIAYAQNADSINISFGTAIAKGGSKIDKTSITYRAPVIFSEVKLKNSGINFRSRFQTGPDKFGGQSVDLSAEGSLLKIGLVKIGPNIRYFYAQDKDIVAKTDQLLVLGQTRKHYLTTGLSAGIGHYRQNNFRIQAEIGAAKMDQQIIVYDGYKLIEGSPVLFNKDLLSVMVFGGRVSLPYIWQKIGMEASVNNIRTLKNGNEASVFRPNINKIIPENQTIVELEVKRPIWRNVSLGVNIISGNDAGMMFLGKSVGIMTSFGW